MVLAIVNPVSGEKEEEFLEHTPDEVKALVEKPLM